MRLMLQKGSKSQVATIKPHTNNKIWVVFENELKNSELYKVEEVREMFKLYIKSKSATLRSNLCFCLIEYCNAVAFATALFQLFKPKGSSAAAREKVLQEKITIAKEQEQRYALSLQFLLDQQFALANPLIFIFRVLG